MNKKFLLAAMLVVASSISYAKVGEIDLGKNYKDTFNSKLGADGQTITSGDIRWAGKDTFDKVNKEFKDVQAQLDGKADIGFVTDQVNQAYNELEGKVNDKLAGKVDTEDFNRLDNEVGQITSDVEAMKGDLNNKVNKDEFENKLNGKADVDFVTGQVDQAYNELEGKVNDKLAGKVDTEDFNRLDNEVGALTGKVEAIDQDKNRLEGEITANKNNINDLNNRLEGYEDVKENANSAIILGQENSNKIDDLYANKVDNSKFEEHKKQQEAKDNDQDGKIQANKDAIEKETADRVAADERLQGQINDFNNKFAGYDGRLSGLEKKVDHLDDKMNKGLSLMAAMNAVDFQNVQTGEMALGAGVGHYGNAQSVALGVAYAPVEDLTVNAKYSITAGDPDSFAVGAGATYKFKVGR